MLRLSLNSMPHSAGSLQNCTYMTKDDQCH